jgi:protoporphyrin/coproporphyrin ferrochelatase
MSDSVGRSSTPLVRHGRRRLAVVVFNLGGPDSLDAVQPFLFNLFADPAIIGLPWPLRPLLAKFISTRRREEASRNYAYMGGRSPLVPETQAQADALQLRLAATLPGVDVRIFMAMRYWRPMTEDTAAAVKSYAPDDVVLLPLYPQFSTTTTASSAKAWRRAYQGPGQVREVCCYFDATSLAVAHANRIRATLDQAGSPEDLRLLFSAHGLPERVIQRGDPYQWQVEQTCAAIMDELGGGWDWKVCYQSRVGPLKWIGPSTPEAIEQAARDGKGVLVVPVAFVSEHVETLVELDRDYAGLAQEKGCPTYLRSPAIGVEEPFIEGLADMVRAALTRTGCQPGASACDRRFSECPFHGAASAS